MTYRRLVRVQLSGGKSGEAYQYETEWNSAFHNLDGSLLEYGTEPFEATSLGVVPDDQLPQWYIDMGNPETVAPAVTVPETITKRQMLIQMLRAGMIAPEEADSIASTPPAFMAPIIAAMPEELALELKITWASMTSIDRHSPMVIAAGQAAGSSNEQMDQFFIAAASI